MCIGAALVRAKRCRRRRRVVWIPTGRGIQRHIRVLRGFGLANLSVSVCSRGVTHIGRSYFIHSTCTRSNREMRGWCAGMLICAFSKKVHHILSLKLFFKLNLRRRTMFTTFCRLKHALNLHRSISSVLGLFPRKIVHCDVDSSTLHTMSNQTRGAYLGGIL